MFESGRFAFFQRLVEHEPPFVIDIVVEINIRPNHGVVQEEPACFGQGITVRFGINEHDMGRQRSLHQALDGVTAQARRRSYLVLRHTFAVRIEHVQDTVLYHQPADLEDHGSP